MKVIIIISYKGETEDRIQVFNPERGCFSKELKLLLKKIIKTKQCLGVSIGPWIVIFRLQIN